MPQSYLVCRADELNDGDRRVVSCDGVEVGVFKIDGQFVAWHNECPHRQGPVCQGRIYTVSYTHLTLPTILRV